STSTVPDVGRSRSPMIESNDVLPDPDGPVSTTNSPGSKVSETPSTATTGPGCTRRTSRTTTRAPRASVSSALDTNLVVEVLLVMVGLDHDPELQPDADRALGPADRVPIAPLEAPGVVARAPVRAGCVVRARVTGGHHLPVVEELVGGLRVDGASRSGSGGDLDPPRLVDVGVVRRGLQVGDERFRRAG